MKRIQIITDINHRSLKIKSQLIKVLAKRLNGKLSYIDLGKNKLPGVGKNQIPGCWEIKLPGFWKSTLA